MKSKKCTRCNKNLKGKDIKYLELSITDGNYYSTIPNKHESQGAFPFGTQCATLQLKETLKLISNKQ